MRLIDADALCKKIRDEYDGYMLDEGCCPIEFENMVDDQPTAFDVEAVVAELEVKDDDCGCGKIEIWKAIDIVRNAGKGGAE